VSTKSEPYVPDAGNESALDELFARLSVQKPSTPPASIKHESPMNREPGPFPFEDASGGQKTPDHVAENVPASESTAIEPSKSSVGDAPVALHRDAEVSQADLEQLYLRKASEYLDALPAGGVVAVNIIKTVSAKLRCTYAPDTKLSAEEVEKLQARYAFAVVNCINQVYKQSATPIKSEIVKKALLDCQGDVLALYNRLVEENYLPLNDLEAITGLGKTILDALPKAEPLATPSAPKAALSAVKSTSNTETTADKTSSEDSRPASNDSVNSLKGWPTQEKRESRKYD
jgi:hypothetical protein